MDRPDGVLKMRPMAKASADQDATSNQSAVARDVTPTPTADIGSPGPGFSFTEVPKPTRLVPKPDELTPRATPEARLGRYMMF